MPRCRNLIKITLMIASLFWVGQAAAFCIWNNTDKLAVSENQETQVDGVPITFYVGLNAANPCHTHKPYDPGKKGCFTPNEWDKNICGDVDHAAVVVQIAGSNSYANDKCGPLYLQDHARIQIRVNNEGITCEVLNDIPASPQHSDSAQE